MWPNIDNGNWTKQNLDRVKIVWMVHPVQNFLQLVHCPLPRNHPLWDGLAENCCILWLRGNFKHCCSITMKQRNKRTCFSPCWKQLEIFKNPKNNIFNIKILLLLTETYTYGYNYKMFVDASKNFHLFFSKWRPK